MAADAARDDELKRLRKERDALKAVITLTNDRMLALLPWAYRELNTSTRHHVLSVITIVLDCIDPDRTHPTECEHCNGTGVEPGSGDYDHTVHMVNPMTQEPCSVCHGTSAGHACQCDTHGGKPHPPTPPRRPPMAGDLTRMSAADIEAARQLAASFPAISDEGELRARAARLASAVRRMAAEVERLRTDLAEAADALRDVGKAAITVAPRLRKPYSDAPETSPWTRFMEQPARRAYNLGHRIRRQLKAADLAQSTDMTGDAT